MSASISPNEQKQMNGLTQHLRTKSDKIRALDKAGYKRQRIADFLGIRYQHVRNVLVQPAPLRARAAAAKAAAPSPPTSAAAVDLAMGGRLAIDAAGGIALPPELLALLKASPGDEIPWWVDGDILHIASWAVSIRRVQAELRSLFPPGVDPVEEFLAEKRAQAEIENKKPW